MLTAPKASLRPGSYLANHNTERGLDAHFPLFRIVNYFILYLMFLPLTLMTEKV